MHRWKIKSLLGNLFGRTAGTAALYRFLTNELLHARKRAPWKWCQWFREHILLCRRHAGIDPYHAALWLFDPGWTIAPGLLAWLTTDGPVFATDRETRLRGVYNRIAVETVLDNLGAVGKRHPIPEEKLALLQRLGKRSDAREVFTKLGIPYYSPAARWYPLPQYQEKVDICLSMGTLEHYDQENLKAQIRWMHDLLRPGGAASHIIDHRDHFWHADKSISPFEFFHYTEQQWRRIGGNRLYYANRLVQSQYVALFEAAGFEIVYLGSKPFPDDGVPLDGERVQPRFRNLSRQDLWATVSHIIAVKR